MLSPTQGDKAELGWLGIVCVGRVTPMQAQICFRASPVCHELGPLCRELRSELLSCELQTASNVPAVHQRTTTVDYKRQNQEE